MKRKTWYIMYYFGLYKIGVTKCYNAKYLAYSEKQAKQLFKDDYQDATIKQIATYDD